MTWLFDHLVGDQQEFAGKLALLIENFPGRRRGFGANMRGTLSLSDELTGEFRNEFDAMSISDLGLLRLLAGKLSPELRPRHSRPRSRAAERRNKLAPFHVGP
jgi:hypothetical protein